MEDEGYVVLEAPSAEAALQLVHQTPPDLMLVDLMLGGMDGFSFIREVRPASQAPIIVLSAKTDTHDIVAALEAGADDYVTKPFQVKEIGARLRALRRRAGAAAPPDGGNPGADEGGPGPPPPPPIPPEGGGPGRPGGEEPPPEPTQVRALGE